MTPPSANLKAMFFLAGVGAASLSAIRLGSGEPDGAINMSKLVSAGMVETVGNLRRNQTYSLTQAGHRIIAEWRMALNQFPALQERRPAA